MSRWWRIERLVPGQELAIRQQDDNEQDPRALLLDVASDEPIEWVPSYLLDYVHKHLDATDHVGVSVERVNGPEACWHMRVLARLEVGSRGAARQVVSADPWSGHADAGSGRHPVPKHPRK